MFARVLNTPKVETKKICVTKRYGSFLLKKKVNSSSLKFKLLVQHKKYFKKHSKTRERVVYRCTEQCLVITYYVISDNIFASFRGKSLSFKEKSEVLWH